MLKPIHKAEMIES